MKILKSLGNFIKGVIVSVWVLVAIFTTICLISYNDYQVSVIGKTSLIIIDNDDLKPAYKEGDLVLVKQQTESGYKEGEYAFFYLDNPQDRVFVNYGQITRIQEADHAEDSYYFGDDVVSYGGMIGLANGSAVYHNAGKILKVFESRWGFMFLVILPTLYAVVYEVYAIVDEVKREAKREKMSMNNENKD